jgi:hypothetical protein
MKILTFALLLCAGSVFGQKSKSTTSNLSTSISDDDKELSIQIKGTINGKKIDFDRTYNIANLSKKEKNKIIHSIEDSLGIKLNIDTPPIPPVPPVAPVPPVPPVPPLPPVPPIGPDAIGVYSAVDAKSQKNHFVKGMGEIQVSCENCPAKGTFSLISTDKSHTLEYSFREEDKGIFPLTFKAKPGRYTFKYNYGKTSFSEIMTLKKDDVIVKKLE